MSFPKFALRTFALLCSLAASSPAQAQPVVLQDAAVHVGDGSFLAKATVVLDRGRIQGVGVDGSIPNGASVIDASGKVITPGFIAADTQLGLLEIDLEAMSYDAQPVLKSSIRAAMRPEDGFNLDSALVGVARRHGITSAISAPQGGVVSGQGGWFDLLSSSDPERSQAFVKTVSLHARLGEIGAQAFGHSRLSAATALRAYLEDARVYQATKSAFRRNQLYRLSAGRLDLEAASDLLLGRVPMVVEVQRASDIRVALRLIKELKIKGILLGVSEGWLVASEIAAARVPVIVDPMQNLPSSIERRNARSDNATLMAKAGVNVILTVRSNHNAGNLRFAVGNAIRAGFPRSLAVRSVSYEVARAFGQGARVGLLKRNQLANLVVWSGDPFEPSTYAERVYIRGRSQPVDSRQTRLARRYIERLGLGSK